jgi:hypothetical protein
MLKAVIILALLGVMIFTIPLAIFVNVVLLLDSYITQIYRSYNKKLKR